jgi:hypothetical protein
LEESDVEIPNEQLEPATAGGERVEVVGREDGLREDHTDEGGLREFEVLIGQLVLDQRGLEEGLQNIRYNGNRLEINIGRYLI